MKLRSRARLQELNVFSPQPNSLGSPGEAALPLVLLTWVSPMVVDKPDWIIIFYKPPKQNGQFTLNLKHFLCLPGALTSPTSPLSSPLLTSLTSPYLSFLFGIKRLFPRCLRRTWSNQLVLCERQRETSTLYGISPTPPFLKEEMERM